MPHIARTDTPLRRRLLVGALVLTTLLFPLVAATRAGANVDLRSPDSRDAANAAQGSPGVDLRSPDSRDAARAAQGSPSVDLRSPDARDAGRVAHRSPSSSAAPSDDFEWGYLAVGGAGVAVVVGLLAATTRRRRRRLERPAVAVRG